MKIPQSDDRYISSWQWVETARYVPALSRIIRDKEGDKPKFISIFDIENYRQQYKNTGLYTSIWHFNSKDIDNAVRLGSLYFDLDNQDPNKSYEDCKKLLNYLQKYIPQQSLLVYFTGKKGFHIECEALALGINPSNALPNIFRYIATKIKKDLDIESIDFSVYDPRRMWRLAGSKHQETNLYKNIIPQDIFDLGLEDIKKYCQTEKDNTVSEQQFSLKANEWFRQFTYDMEIDKNRSSDFLEYFNKHGSTAFKEVNLTEKEFTPKELLKNCSAISRLIEQAKVNKKLEHEARLFLCSILTYNEDSIKFLYSILSLCDDFNYEKSTSHINDWIKRRQLGIGGRPYTCDRANSVGVGCGDCNLEKKKKWITVGNKYIESSEELSPSPIRFAYKQKGDKKNAR
jgi:hypothetical protein